MIEIMEPTDFAVRIEFERGGYVLPEESRFMNRGIDFALSMFNYNVTPIETVKEDFFCKPRVLESQNNSKEHVLIDEQKTSCFKVNRIHVKDSYIKESATFYTGIVTNGYGTIAIDNQIYPVKEGLKFLVPFQTSSIEFASENGMEIIATFPPE